MPTRRQFVATSGSAVLAAAAAACGGGGDGPTSPPPTMGGGGGGGGGGATEARAPLPAVGATISIGGVGLGNQGIAVTRLSTNSVVAVSRQCTHQQCTVNLPGSPGSTLNCPCHGSRFTTSGSVVNGPATAPLRTYPARIEGSEVVVTL